MLKQFLSMPELVPALLRIASIAIGTSLLLSTVNSKTALNFNEKGIANNYIDNEPIPGNEQYRHFRTRR